MVRKSLSFDKTKDDDLLVLELMEKLGRKQSEFVIALVKDNLNALGIDREKLKNLSRKEIDVIVTQIKLKNKGIGIIQGNETKEKVPINISEEQNIVEPTFEEDNSAQEQLEALKMFGF